MHGARQAVASTSVSTREAELLRLLSQGLTNRELAERLFITVGTVKGHLHRIYRKLEVCNRTAAIARAREFGVL
jgi:LuxR family transcriptional regulator, maltose regulon positive regulatory protein